MSEDRGFIDDMGSISALIQQAKGKQKVPQDSPVVCDHYVGYTYDPGGPSMFKQSEIQWSLEHASEMPKTGCYGIEFWNYCPNCGVKLSPPNAEVDAPSGAR